MLLWPLIFIFLEFSLVCSMPSPRWDDHLISVRPPFSGIFRACYFKLGDNVQPGQSLGEIQSMDGQVVAFALPPYQQEESLTSIRSQPHYTIVHVNKIGTWCNEKDPIIALLTGD